MNSQTLPKLFDLSCVQMYNTQSEVEELVRVAEKYGFAHITTLQCFLSFARKKIGNSSHIKLIGNIGFPSGTDSTTVKAVQAREMMPICDEIDMVMNVSMLKSGQFKQVEEDVREIRKVLDGITMKVIIESPYLTDDEIRAACEIVANSGADYVKTGTGWGKPVSLDNVKLIKSVVEDRVAIKASGGVSNLDQLILMHEAGAARFGVNMKSGIAILNEMLAREGAVNN